MAMICLDKPERPWVGSAPPCDEVDKQLFRVSTIVFLGDGNKASFWNCSWLNGLAPRDIAPGLLQPTKLLARNWPCESNCVLCDPVTETAAHLCLQCPFAKQLWLLVNSWTNNVIPLLIDLDEHVDDW